MLDVGGWMLAQTHPAVIDPLSSLFQNANFTIGFPKLAAKAEAKVMQQFDFDRRMGFPQMSEVLQAKQIAFDLGIRLDHRRARGAIYHGHLAESHASGESGQTLWPAGRQWD